MPGSAPRRSSEDRPLLSFVRPIAETTMTAVPFVRKLSQVIHRRVDRASLVVVLARRRYALDVVEQEQLGVEGVGGRGDVGQVERRPDEGEPLGERFEGVHRLVDAVGVLRPEPPMSNQGQIDAGQPGKLAVEQNGRAHLDIADDSPKGRRQPQGVDDALAWRMPSCRPLAPRQAA